MSARNCGCDPEARHTCEGHRLGAFRTVSPAKQQWLTKQAATIGTATGMAIEHGFPVDIITDYARMAGFFGLLVLEGE